ncbi:MAG: family N-acetyltransferase [Devosia sp.]|uniref:GNAT family N-acetyltransferase n=1 Tax=Devosia sp. TaxID=1871048 RepID=UPI00261B5F78|nr:GNAT family N-acetyltransferase [Devosia sp.]MDB5539786.1 family N-acetyltransferase [Devosia sp.]
MSLDIRSAVPADAALIIRFVEALAAYEKLSHEAEATEADVLRDLFGPSPKVFCEIAERDGKAEGFALWYYTYSTFQGRHGIWLEDLFVNPEARGGGVGKALLANLAQRCVREALGRFEWAVLKWNQPSIDFYQAHGAVFLDAWERCRISGDALQRLGTT